MQCTHITAIHSLPKNMHSSLVQNRGILQRGTSMSDCESMFNDYERKNKETITAYESRKGWR